MRKCSYCGKECSDDSIICPIDHTPLVTGALEDNFTQGDIGFDFCRLQLRSIWHTRIIGSCWILAGLPGLYLGFPFLAHNVWAWLTNGETELAGAKGSIVFIVSIFSLGLVVTGYGVLWRYRWAKILCRIASFFILAYAFLMLLELLTHWDNYVWPLLVGNSMVIGFFAYSLVGLGYKQSCSESLQPER